MILTLAWKEYREHRSVWFTMVLLTGLLAFGIVQLSAPGDASITSRVGLIVLGMAAAYGVVCGSMMLAGERENGTLVFLDIFLARRGLLWLWKGLVGVLFAVTEALAVATVLYFLKEEPPTWLVALVGQGRDNVFGVHLGMRPRLPMHYWFWVVPLVTLEAYAWGLLGSALTRRVLSGAGLALLIAAPFWVPAVCAPPVFSVGLRLVLVLVALIISINVFITQSRDTPLGTLPRDVEEALHMRRKLAQWNGERFEPGRPSARRAEAHVPVVATVEPVPEVLPVAKPVQRTRRRPPEARSPDQVLWWLTLRQAWAMLGALSGAALLVGLAIPSAGQVLWPLATLLLGVACGTATFAQEQSDLSYQFLATQHLPLRTVWRVKLLFWFAAAIVLCALLVMSGAVAAALAYVVRRPGAGPGQVGFAFGTLRQILGPVLFFGVWLVYGFSLGQLCVWYCRKSVLAVLLAVVIGATALGLWMPSLLCLGMSGWQVWIPPLVILLATRYLVRAWAGGRIKERKPLVVLTGFGLASLAWFGLVFVVRAWQIPDVGEPLDRAAFRAAVPTAKDNVAGPKIEEAVGAFDDPNAKQGAWLALLTEVSRLPVGVIETPRGTGQEPTMRHLQACHNMTNKLRMLAEAAQVGGRSSTMLDHVVRLLALSRNLRNKAPLTSYLAGVEVEAVAVGLLDWWLAGARPTPDHLRRALDELNRHAAETPPALDCLQTECYRAGGLLDNPSGWSFRSGAGRVPERWLADGIAASLDTPWETERRTRLWRAVWAGLFRALQTPYAQLPKGAVEPEGKKAETRRILASWLPATDGPSVSVDRTHLARLLDESWLADERLFVMVVPLRAAATRAKWRVDACRMALALGLYQLSEGMVTQRLEDLVPKYLPKLPRDPYSGESFHYRVSKGERIEEMNGPGGPAIAVAPGQGILWSTGPDCRDDGGRQHGGWVPEDAPQWNGGGMDLVTVIPRWK